MPWKKSELMDQRREFALKALGTLNFRALCQEYGISPKTGYKWRERLLRQGLEGMEEDSRRQRSSHKQLSEGQVCEMVKLKVVHRHWGPRKIRTLYHRRHGQAPSESSFKRVLEQVGLTQPRRVREGPLEGGRLSSGRRGQEPNEVWTVDFKGWWRFGEAGRCEPLTVRDEFSRYVLELRAMDNARSQTVREAFERIFERHGLPEAIRSDNEAPFASVQALHGLSRLSAWWVALGISIWNEVDRRIRKITEGTNGCIGTSLKSWKAWVKEPRQRRWSCGERSLTGSARTKRWGCIVRRNCTGTRAGATAPQKCN